jgi:outer membrane protein assembly factor BamB
MKISRYTVAISVFGLALAGVAWAQLGGLATQEWSTSGGDAQRSNWIRKDTLISKAAMASGKFGFLWKLKVNNQARQLNAFSRAALVGNAMGYKGFRSLTMLAGASNTLFAVDNDFGVMYWEKHFDAPIPAESTEACPGGMTAAATRPIDPNPAAVAGRGPGIRTPFWGALSEPGAGAPLDSGASRPSAARPNAAGPGAAAQGRAGRANAAGPSVAGQGRAGRRRRRGPSFGLGAQPIAALSSDGVLHFVSPVSAKELLKPLQFVPANAHATDLAWVNGVVYTATVNGCGGVPNAVWAIDTSSENPQATSWKTNGGSVAGTLAFGSDGTIYAAIGDGKAADGGYSNAVVALDSETLRVKDWFTQPGAGFTSIPVVFRSEDKELLAAAAGDGRIFLLDTASLGGADHKTPLDMTPPSSGSRASVVPAALASWEDGNGVRWLLAPSAAPSPSSGLTAANGTVTHGAIVAYKVTLGAKPSLEPAWVSRDMVAPLPPIIVNGVIYAAASGEHDPGDATVDSAERAKRSSPAVLYALDATTGAEIWNSGGTVTSFMHGTGLSSSPGQVYLATSDNTVYAFGMPYERQ